MSCVIFAIEEKKVIGIITKKYFEEVHLVRFVNVEQRFHDLPYSEMIISKTTINVDLLQTLATRTKKKLELYVPARFCRYSNCF